MAKTTIDTWNPSCLSSPIFKPLRFLASQLTGFTHWPSLNDYQTILDSTNTKIYSKNHQPIKFVPQDEKSNQFEDHYEPRIYLKGEVQTRLENWHDFFQVLVWRTFPNIKIELNACHYRAALQRSTVETTRKNRSPIENAITLFDECGAIIVTSDHELANLVREHQWKALFWSQRQALASQFKCIVFGHALYEKALQPYIGMTAHCIIVEASEKELLLPSEQLNAFCDETVMQYFAGNNPKISSPKSLSPFPLLGMPGWHPENHQESFYDNAEYFRPKRNTRQ